MIHAQTIPAYELRKFDSIQKNDYHLTRGLNIFYFLAGWHIYAFYVVIMPNQEHSPYQKILEDVSVCFIEILLSWLMTTAYEFSK